MFYYQSTSLAEIFLIDKFRNILKSTIKYVYQFVRFVNRKKCPNFHDINNLIFYQMH